MPGFRFLTGAYSVAPLALAAGQALCPELIGCVPASLAAFEVRFIVEFTTFNAIVRALPFQYLRGALGKMVQELATVRPV